MITMPADGLAVPFRPVWICRGDDAEEGGENPASGRSPSAEKSG
jgi:hypothetical protein